MPAQLAAALAGKNPSKKLVIGVAIDGSVLSDKALSTACEYCKPSRGDRLVILHVADPRKKDLPRHLQPTHLRNVYEAKAATQHLCAEWACRDKTEQQSTCEALMLLADEKGVDLLVLGSWGRKGEKIDMLGTVSDYSLREGHASVVVVRSTSPPTNEGHTYMFATDGSHAASLALTTLTQQLLHTPKDKLIIVAAQDDNSPTQVDDYLKPCKELLAEAKVEAQFVVCKLAREQTVADGLLSLARTKEVTDLVVGISGYGKKKLGSVSEELTKHATCNTLVIKDPYEVLSDTYASAGARTLTEVLQPAAATIKQRSSIAGAVERRSFDRSATQHQHDWIPAHK